MWCNSLVRKVKLCNEPLGPSDVLNKLDTDRAAKIFAFCASRPLILACCCCSLNIINGRPYSSNMSDMIDYSVWFWFCFVSCGRGLRRRFVFSNIRYWPAGRAKFEPASGCRPSHQLINSLCIWFFMIWFQAKEISNVCFIKTVMVTGNIRSIYCMYSSTSI